MKKSTFHAAAAIAAFSLASAVMAQNAQDVNPPAGSDQWSRDSNTAPGTIQWGPPQQQQSPPGAQGPVRSDTGLASDPSIRDNDPLTRNGPWEQLSGDRVVNQAIQQQPAQSQQPSEQQSQQQ